VHNRYRGEEIAVSATVPLVEALLKAGVASHRLPAAAELDSPRSRISWNQFLAILAVARANFSDEQLGSIGADGLSSSHYLKRLRWARRLLTLEDAYRFMVFPHRVIDYGCIQAAVDARPGHVNITSILKSGYEPSETLFLLMRGAALELPNFFGAKNVRVEGDQTDRYMHFDIRFSVDEPRVSKVKRWMSAWLRNAFFAFNNSNANSELIARTFALEQSLVERDEARDALAQDRREHRRRMQNLTEVIVEYDHLNQIQYLSPNCERVFGYPNNLLLSDPLKILRPQDRGQAEIAMARSGSIASGVYPVQALHADGRLMQVQVTITQFSDDQGRPRWIATLRDVGAIAVRQPATLASPPSPTSEVPSVRNNEAKNVAEVDILVTSNRPKLLLADDDQMTRRIAQKILTKAGFTVLCVEGGAAVLEQLDNHEFSLLLLDINMPGMSGLEVYDALQARAEELPVIFVSGNPDQLTSTHSGHAVVRKPFRSAQLIQTIREVIAA